MDTHTNISPCHTRPATIKYIRAFFLLLVTSLLLTPSAHAREATEYTPLIVPVRLHGMGTSIGFGYSGTNLIKDGDFAGLVCIGDMQGVSLLLSDLTFVDDWFRLDGQLIHLSKLAPITNYSRGSAATPVLWRPQLSLSSIEIGLSVQPTELVSFKVAPGSNNVHFDSFSTEGKSKIETPSIHITDLDQPYIKTELALRYADKKKLHYVGALARLINRNKSSGYSGDQVTSYRIDGQYSFYGLNAIYAQYFHSDAQANDKTKLLSTTDIANTLNIDCSTSSTVQECQKLSNALTSYIASHNTYGTAEALGGPERMRAYPTNYFRAAHSRYAVVELRFERFDRFDNKDFFFRLFSEMAQVSDQEQDLSDSTVLSNGIDLGANINEDINYKVTVANGNDGWVAHVSLTHNW